MNVFTLLINTNIDKVNSTAQTEVDTDSKENIQ